MAKNTNKKKQKAGRELVIMFHPGDEKNVMRAETEAVGVPLAGDSAMGLLRQILSSESLVVEKLFGERAASLRSPQLEALPAAVSPLDSFYKIVTKENLEDLRDRLLATNALAAAYIKPAPEPAFAAVNDFEPLPDPAPPVTADFTSRQLYLLPAPGGVDALFAWKLPGGKGKDINIIDIEGAWNFTHEDLIRNQGGLISGIQSRALEWRNHGTAVAGVFGGDDNGFGITGICPDANTRAISIFTSATKSDTGEAIRKAANALNAGDIILIELHYPGPRFGFKNRNDQRGYIPVEWWPDNFAAIKYAVSRGILVVEAAGNGAEDLDSPLYNSPATGFPQSWTNPFNMANPQSGAILVGAGAPPPGTHGSNHGTDRSRLDFSNWGSRVDIQGWGREVTTCGYGNLQGGDTEDCWYTDTFSGTSSASPIIVGVLGCIQGRLKAKGMPLLTPAKAVQLFRNTGGQQQSTPGRPASQRIGNRPDLREIFRQLGIDT